MIYPPGDQPLTRFRTLHDRDVGAEPDDTLHDGVPDHLREPLLRWWRDVSVDSVASRTCERVLSRLRIDSTVLAGGARMSDAQAIGGAISDQSSIALDLINAFVGMNPNWGTKDVGNRRTWTARISDLESRLIDAGSVWTVDRELRGLYRRVDPTVVDARKAAETSATAAGRHDAATHLRSAWERTYGMHPDPNVAYGEAVRAVEAAAIPVVSPRNQRATLGTVIADMSRQSWNLILVDAADNPGDAAPFIEMLNRLWQGQRSRHAGSTNTRAQTQDEAEGAVHLAALAVQWFTCNAVRKATP